MLFVLFSSSFFTLLSAPSSVPPPPHHLNSFLFSILNHFSQLAVATPIIQPSIMAATGNNCHGTIYTLQERMDLIDISGDVLPISTVQWEEVADVHSQNYDQHTTDSLKFKFMEL